MGFYKKDSGRPSITWPESVDEVLCVGWVGGVRRRIDEVSYTIRFTPRKPRSSWSAINIDRARVLKNQGRMLAAGLAAFQRRSEEKSTIYAYEQRAISKLDEPFELRFRSRQMAWAFFQSQSASYQMTEIWRIVSAKKPDTRQARLEKLIAASTRHERL